MDSINYLFIAGAAVVAIGSPGPATLAIMALSMNQGRKYGLMIALGIFTGSLTWSTAAAFGLAAVMHTNVWLFELMRYVGVMYLLYLSWLSLRAAYKPSVNSAESVSAISLSGAYWRGLLIHLTNPKAILFFGALYSLALPAGTSLHGLLSVILFVGFFSASIFFGYALLFSSGKVSAWYVRSKRAFNLAFGVLFGVAGFRLLATRLND